MLEEKERLKEEWNAFDEQRKNFTSERKNFTEAAIRLGREVKNSVYCIVLYYSIIYKVAHKELYC